MPVVCILIDLSSHTITLICLVVESGLCLCVPSVDSFSNELTHRLPPIKVLNFLIQIGDLATGIGHQAKEAE